MVKHGVGLLLCILIPAALAALFWKIRPISATPLATPSPTEARDTGSDAATDPVTAEHRRLQKAMALDETSARRELDRLCTPDPHVAANFALTLSPSLLTPTTIGNVLSALSRVSPQEALLWAQKLPAGHMRQDAVDVLNHIVADRSSGQPR